MTEFYVTLPSNTKVKGNTTANYRCPLAHALDLDGVWEVGLAEIQYPHSWNRIRNGYVEVRLNISSGKPPLIDRIVIPDGDYTKVQQLMEVLEKGIDQFWKYIIETVLPISEGDAENIIEVVEIMRKMAFKLKYDELTKLVSVTIDRGLFKFVHFNLELRHALGFVDIYEMKDEEKLVASHFPNFYGQVSNLFIYMDIITHQLVGDSKVPLLKMVPVQGKFGDIVNLEYPNIHYVSLLSKQFHSISINIRGDIGELIPFSRGKVLVKLHFRKKKKLYYEGCV